nr:heparan sulfate glucosamine 3-O-sulfotransferase 5-like [Lytechinus pictus]
MLRNGLSTLRRDRTNAHRIIPLCAILCACAILLLIRSGRVPSVLTIGKRATASESILRDARNKRYFYNRTAIRFKKTSEVRQCYHLSRSMRNQLLDVESRDDIGCKQRVPDVIVVGAKEGGEESLRFFLDRHPSVMFHSTDTIRYFDRPTFRRVKGMPWYMEKMPYTSPDQVTVEMGSDYFASSTAPDGIRNDIVPKPKLIVIIRDPVKRALLEYHSAHSVTGEVKNKGWVKNTKRYPYLDSLHQIDESFTKTVMSDGGDIHTWNGVVNVGMYVIHLRRWFEWFGRSQIMTVDGDRLETDPIPVLQAVEDFIGVPRYFENSAVAFDKRSKSYCLVRPFSLCPPSKPSYPSPDQNTVNALRSFYHRYDRQLYQMLGSNFTWFKDSLFVNKTAFSLSEVQQTADEEDPIQESSDQLVEDENQ